MRKQIEALKLALEALEYIYEGANNQGPHTGISWRCVSNKAEPAITVIREALAEQPAQQEGSVFTFGEVERTMLALKTGTFEQQQAYEVMKNKPLYTAPQPSPATELREQQEPKPKFVRNVDGVPCITLVEHEHLMRSRPQPAQPSQSRSDVKPLTDEQITDHFQEHIDTGSLLSFADGVRFAEAAHGITGEQK